MPKGHQLVSMLDVIFIQKRLFFYRELNRLCLYPGQLPVVEFVISNRGCTQTEVAKSLDLTPASIAVSTKRLEKAGMLIKQVDPENLRCKRLYATELGLQTAKKYRQALDSFHKQMFIGFSESELDDLRQYLFRMLQNLPGGHTHPAALFKDMPRHSPFCSHCGEEESPCSKR